MKKLFLLLVLPLIMFCFSCGSTPPQDEIISFPLNASLSFSDVRFNASVCGDKTVFTLQDMDFSLVFEKGIEKACCGKYERTVEKNTFPAPESLAYSLSAAQSVEPKRSKGLLTYTLDETTLLVYYNEETREVYRLAVKKNGKEFTFDVISVNR